MLVRRLDDYRRRDDRRALLQATTGDSRCCIGDAGHDAPRSDGQGRRRTGAAGRPPSRPGSPRPSARRHRDRAGEPGHRGRIPGGGRPVRHDAVESRHLPRRRPGRRRVCLHGQPDQRLQPHPPERHRLPLLPGRAHPAHRRRHREESADHGCRVLARARAGQSRSVPGPARSHLDHRRARRHDAYRHRQIFLSIGHAVQHPLQGRGQREPRLRLERAYRRPRPSRGSGHQRRLLPDRHELHAPLRRAIQPTLLVGRELDRFGRIGRAHQLCGYIVRGVRELRYDDPTRCHDEGRHLLRQHPRRSNRTSPPRIRAGRSRG